MNIRSQALEFILHHSRVYANKILMAQGEIPSFFAISDLLRWLKTLDDDTLCAYSDTLMLSAIPNDLGRSTDDYFDLIFEAKNRNVDSDSAAMMLFIMTNTKPLPTRSDIMGFHIKVYEDVKDLLSGLFDLLEYRREFVSDDVAEVVIAGNIYTCSDEARAKIKALLNLHEHLISYQSDRFINGASTYIQRGDDYIKSFSMDKDTQSAWADSGELVKCVLDNHHRIKTIIEVISERGVVDVAIVNEALATTEPLASGVL